MEVFIKSFSTYRTVKMAISTSHSLVVDSLDPETSSITVMGEFIGQEDAGNWLIADGRVYSITNVKPGIGNTIISLGSPLEVFSRPLELVPQPLSQTVGGFISEALLQNWADGEDPVYAIPYLAVSSSDSTAFAPPDLDSSGCFKLSEYCRLMRKSYRVAVQFTDGGDKLRCSISRTPERFRQISFQDGHSQLQSAEFSSSGYAKLTVIHDVKTGEKDENGDAIYARSRSTWYLAEDGTVSQLIPSRRASGGWGSLYIKGDADVFTKVVETFAKNKRSHKIEFWSTLDLNIQDQCTFLVSGKLMQSYVSYKRKSSQDRRYYYKFGELATTATEKLRGAMK